MTDNINIVSQVQGVAGKVDTMWTDLYGDEKRHERGLIQEIRGVMTAINRFSIVLVFFSLISLLNLIILVWVVLAL